MGGGCFYFMQGGQGNENAALITFLWLLLVCPRKKVEMFAYAHSKSI
jgi:hypothetical protein